MIMKFLAQWHKRVLTITNSLQIFYLCIPKALISVHIYCITIKLISISHASFALHFNKISVEWLHLRNALQNVQLFPRKILHQLIAIKMICGLWKYMKKCISAFLGPPCIDVCYTNNSTVPIVCSMFLNSLVMVNINSKIFHF